MSSADFCPPGDGPQAADHPLHTAAPAAAIRPLCGRRQVLALSGGGYRGLFTARVLEHLETDTHTQIRDHFQLCVGTSAGALIAAALAHGIEAHAIRDCFQRHGPRIFRRDWTTPWRRLFHVPYGVDGLNLAMDKLFGRDRELLDTALATLSLPLILTAVGLRSHRAKILGGKGLGDGRHPRITLRQAILASAAAPTYFPAVCPPTDEALVDGGLVANAPELVALAYGRKALAVKLDDLYLLGVGSAAPDSSHVISARAGRGGLGWLLSSRGLVQLTLDGQEDLSVRLTSLLAGDRYLRIDRAPSPAQAQVIALDSARPEATVALLDLADQCFAEYRDRADLRAYFS